jgi:hypothetical protein
MPAGGCSGGSDAAKVTDRYSLKIGSSGWQVMVTVNGQPVLDTVERDSGWDATTFVIDGVNTVHVSATQLVDSASGSSGGCGVQILRSRAGQGQPNVEEVLRFSRADAAKGQKMDEELTFRASVPVRWRWQDGEDVSNLTQEDGKAILALINQAVDLYRNRDWKGLQALRASAWAGDRPPEEVLGSDLLEGRRKGLDLMATVGQYDDYTVTVAPPESFLMLPGSRVVMVCVGGGANIVTAGHSPSYAVKGSQAAADPALRETRMRFFRKEGQWYWY